MKMKRLYCLLGFVLVSGIFSQVYAQSLERSAIVSAGNDNFTFGEIITDPVSTGDYMLSPGFQQTDTISMTISVEERGIEEMTVVKVYPNPAYHYLNLESDLEDLGSGVRLQGKLVSLSGQEVLQFDLSHRIKSIDIRQLSAGTYILVVIDQTGKVLASTKISKVTK